VRFRPYQTEYRTLAKTITLKMTVAIPATSMVKARCGSNGMRHPWRLSSDGSVDLRQENRVPLICSGLPVPRGPAILSHMGTKSRQTIYGASVRAAGSGGPEGSRPARLSGVERAHAGLQGTSPAVADAR
jgi:hypothetical protein